VVSVPYQANSIESRTLGEGTPIIGFQCQNECKCLVTPKPDN